VPTYPAQAEQNGSSAPSPGTPVGSGATVIGRLGVSCPEISVEGNEVVGSLEEPDDEQAGDVRATSTSHQHRLDLTRRS